MRPAWIVCSVALAILLTGRAHGESGSRPLGQTPNPVPDSLPEYLPTMLVDDAAAAASFDFSSAPLSALAGDDLAGGEIPVAAQPVSASGPLSASVPFSEALHLPIILNDAMPFRSERMGYNTSSRSIRAYPQIRSLRAGWYLDWRVRASPARPGGIDYVQTVRVHQRLACGTPDKPYGYGADRRRCPYSSPPAYDVRPSVPVIQDAARANPGSIWLIGNEMDAMDWEGDGLTGFQDEMTPQLYAVAYHDLYKAIRAADPTARIAIGGVIQFTPLRQYYLEIILTTYKTLFGTLMPIDVWNVHNFIGPELCRINKKNDDDFGKRRCYGMGIPPGIDVPYNDRNEQVGSYVGEDWRHTDTATFRKQIVDLRTWMLHMGYGHVPLMISEYGVLYTTLCSQTDAAAKQRCIKAYGNRYVDLENPRVVADFMVSTFDYFSSATDRSISLVDGGKLVQQWAWFSLEDVGWSFNPYGALFNRSTGTMTATGRRYAAYALQQATSTR